VLAEKVIIDHTNPHQFLSCVALRKTRFFTFVHPHIFIKEVCTIECFVCVVSITIKYNTI
jgi:hypothetical protein